MLEAIDLTSTSGPLWRKNLENFFSTVSSFSSLQGEVKYSDELAISIKEFISEHNENDYNEAAKNGDEAEKNAIIISVKSRIISFKQQVMALKLQDRTQDTKDYNLLVEALKKREDNLTDGIEVYSTDSEKNGCVINEFNPYMDCLNYLGTHKVARMNPDAIVPGHHMRGNPKTQELTIKASKQYPNAEGYIIMGCSTGLREINNEGNIKKGQSYMEYVCENTQKLVVAPCGIVECDPIDGTFSISLVSERTWNTLDKIDNIGLDDIGKKECGYAVCDFDKQTGRTVITQKPELFKKFEEERLQQNVQTTSIPDEQTTSASEIKRKPTEGERII